MTDGLRARQHTHFDQYGQRTQLCKTCENFTFASARGTHPHAKTGPCAPPNRPDEHVCQELSRRDGRC